MVSKKKRFQVLNRDRFSCRYCGQKAPSVQIEIDHILPKSEGGDDSLDNLVAACFSCNRGKGKSIIQEGGNSMIWLTKLKDAFNRSKKMFYSKWNFYQLGTIERNTSTLLHLYIKSSILGEDNRQYTSILDIPPLEEYFTCDKTGTRLDIKEMDIKFRLGGEYCDALIDFLESECNENVLGIFDQVLDDSIRRIDDYDRRLNYSLTEDMENFGAKIMKYTLYPNIIKEWQKRDT